MHKPGLYANIQAKRERIAAGSGERMRQQQGRRPGESEGDQREERGPCK